MRTGWAVGEWWRWKITPDGVLASPIGEYCWETRDYEAFCRHTPPTRCWCGIYGFTSQGACYRHIRAPRMFAPALLDLAECGGVVLGLVRLSDDAFLAKSGPPMPASPEWKASAARITRLCTDDARLCEPLAARYGVPVSRETGLSNV